MQIQNQSLLDHQVQETHPMGLQTPPFISINLLQRPQSHILRT
jgi:hypothetical protein